MATERDNPVRLGVIGAGLIGKKHAALIKKTPGIRLAAISDVNPAAAKLAGELGTEYYADYERMLNHAALEGVIVATPTDLHTPVGVVCAQHGIHLLVEKPIAQSVADAQVLVDSARAHKVHLLVGHHRRHNPMVQSVRRAINDGKIGKLVAVSVLWMLMKPKDYFQVEWRTRSGGGPVLINMIHDIDNLRYICGEIQRVYAETSSAVRGFEVEDSAGISLRFANGALGSIMASDCTPSNWSYEQGTGENPYYFRTHGNCYIFFGTEAALSFPDMNLVRFENPAQAGWQHPMVSEHIDVVAQDPLVVQLKHFGNVIRGEEEPRITGEDGLRTLAVAQAVLDSGKSGSPIEFSY
jgi:predicted dehydrogenase